MKSRATARLWQLALAIPAAVLFTSLAGSQHPIAEEASRIEAVMPAYDEQDRLLLPDDYRRWIFIGSSLGLGYSESRGGMEMFHHTFMEPTAYEHFTRTGEFREGTMLVLMLHGTGDGELPQRRGRFADDVHGVEMAVKDSRTFEDGWAYFGFGGMGGIRDRAAAFASDSCFSCHSEHGGHDSVFTQFYPLLVEAAPAGSTVRAAAMRR